MTAPQASLPPASLRLDRALWYLRLARSRALAQALARSGYVRINRRRIDSAHAPVRPGDVLTLPRGREVLVIELLTLPAWRGPANEAQAHYRAVDSASDANGSQPARGG